MATVRSRSSHAPPTSTKAAAPASQPWFLLFVDGTFAFLASLRLAVTLIATLAAVLGYATFYERANGTQAVQVDIYQSVWFALLLAMLGVNILCAALIRFPWKRRQTGFVITHAGLITLLIGAFLSIQLADEGQVLLPEGSSTEEFYRTERPVFRVEKLDPATRKSNYQATVGFKPGAQAWESETRARLVRSPDYLRQRNLERAGWVVIAVGLFALVGFLAYHFQAWTARPLGALVLALLTGSGLLSAARACTFPIGPREDVLSDPGSPFRLVMKDYLPHATPPRDRHEAGPNGVPMLRMALLAQGPGQKEASDALGDRGWLVANRPLGVGTINLRLLTVRYQAVEGQRGLEVLDDFLHLPPDPRRQRQARIHYTDSSSRRRVYDWILDEADAALERAKPVREGKTIALPDSDLSVTFMGVVPFPTRRTAVIEESSPHLAHLLEEIREATASEFVTTAAFEVRKGNGPAIPHLGWAGLPLAPALARNASGGSSAGELAQIALFDPPRIRDPLNENDDSPLGHIDLLSTDDGRIFYRSFGRSQVRGPREIGLHALEPILEGDQMPMKLSLRAEEFLASGRTRRVCEPLPIPKETGQAMPAALLELTVEGASRQFWLQRSEVETVTLGSNFWRVQYDFDRGKLPFRVSLIDFDPSNDPGTMSRSAFRSDVVVRELGASAERSLPFSELKPGGFFTFLDRPRESFVKVNIQSYQPFDGGDAQQVAETAAEVQPIPQPIKITMNNPLMRQDWSFYQSRFNTMTDERGQPTGTFQSILSVRHDPAWPVVYGGCLLVVVGTFVQFYMRAGVFSDGGKRERASRGVLEPALASATSNGPASSGRPDSTVADLDI
jgi:hypothetical protein